MPRKVAAAPGQDWPGIRIHAIDIVHPPGMSIPPIADMDVDHHVVTAALAAKSNADLPKKARADRRPDIVWHAIVCSFVAATRSMIRLSAWRIRRDAATTCPSRCVPRERDRATGTSPR